MPRFRLVSKPQVSGWRFLLHRLEHALVRRDASMRDDPQRGHSTALLVGVALACVGVAGAAVMAWFKPAGVVGNSSIVLDQSSGGIYVRLGARLHPVTNLTSARLITGTPAGPTKVPPGEIAKYPRGPLLGIPGAPAAVTPNRSRDSHWAVCDAAPALTVAPLDPDTGMPTAARTAVTTLVAGAPLTLTPGVAAELGAAQARLLRYRDATWLVYRDPAGRAVRARIDMAAAAVTSALGIEATARPVPASRGLIDAIPEALPLTVPSIAAAGAAPAFDFGQGIRVGSVVRTETQSGSEFYVVMPDGALRISTVVAAMIRAADSQGASTTPAVAPDRITAHRLPGTLPATDAYPPQPVTLVDAGAATVTCWRWSRGKADSAASATVVLARAFPLREREREAITGLVTAPRSNGGTADLAYLPAGRFVQVTGPGESSPLRESLWWIGDTGVRYGVQTDGSGDRTLAALGLDQPVLAPWSVVTLLAPGPTLSQRDARIQHDGVPADRKGIGLPSDTPGSGTETVAGVP